MSEDLSELKKAEETKRRRAVDPLVRWRQIQEAIDWAKEAMPPSRWKIQTRLKRGIEAGGENTQNS